MLDTIGKYNAAFHRVNDIDDKNCCCWSSILWNCQCCQQWSLESMELSWCKSPVTLYCDQPATALCFVTSPKIENTVRSWLVYYTLTPTLWVPSLIISVLSMSFHCALCALSASFSFSVCWQGPGHHVPVQLAHSACLWLWWRADAHWLCIDDEAVFIPKCVCWCAQSSSWRSTPFLDSSTVSPNCSQRHYCAGSRGQALRIKESWVRIPQLPSGAVMWSSICPSETSMT